MTIDWRTATDAAHQRVLEAAADAASEVATDAWLVGGPVRDLLLGRSITDIDLCVEANAAGFAAALARRLDAPLVEHEKFLTFRIDVRDLEPVDVVTCRRESYAHPGALPDVLPSTLDDDLRRRDFTVNAMALNVATLQLVDPTGGRADLDRRLIRTLHPSSFVDDATRIFRALRLATRLEFDLEPDTRLQLSTAIDDGHLGSVTRQRLWREAEIAASEESAGTVFGAFLAARALPYLIGRCMPEAESLLPNADPSLKRHPDCSRIVVLIAAALENMTGSSLRDAPLPDRDRSRIERLVSHRARFPHELSRLSARSILLTERLGSDILALAETMSPGIVDQAARAASITRMKISIDFVGEIPLSARRRIGHALRHARLAVLRGDIADTETSAFARADVLQYLERTHSR